MAAVSKDQYKSIRKGFQQLANGKLGITRAQWVEIAKTTGVPDEQVAGATFDGFDIDHNGYGDTTERSPGVKAGLKTSSKAWERLTGFTSQI